jgi:hypothetical protein
MLKSFYVLLDADTCWRDVRRKENQHHRGNINGQIITIGEGLELPDRPIAPEQSDLPSSESELPCQDVHQSCADRHIGTD